MAKHELGDMNAIRATLESWLQNHLYGAGNLVLGELAFPKESGESSVTLILQAEMNGVPQRYICRMEPLQSEVFDEHDLPMQYRLMQLASDNGVPVPPLLGLEEDTSLLGTVFYIMGFVDGEIPSDNPPYSFGSWVTELSDEQRSTMWRNGIETLARIHRIDIDSHDASFIPASATGASPVQHEIDKFNLLLTDDITGRFPPSVMRAVDYVNGNAPQGGTRRLCWGDSRVGNIIWKNLEPVAVIDWEMASIGNPLLDVSWWYWIDYVNSVGLGVQRPGGLPSLEEIYSSWQALTGLSTGHSDYYDLFNLLRYTIILEKKVIAMEKAGIAGIGNFCVPFLEQKMRDMDLL